MVFCNQTITFQPDADATDQRIPAPGATRVEIVLADIDDTLTDDGRLTAGTYAALERLQAAG